MIPPLSNYIKRPLDDKIDQKILDLSNRTGSLETEVGLAKSDITDMKSDINALFEEGEWIGI